MPISKDQKTDRVLIAMALEDRFLEILSLVEIRQKQNKPWLGEVIELFTLAFLAVANRRVADDTITEKATRFGQEVGLSTFTHQDDDYMTSADRAINMAATESNAIMCYGELSDAVKAGKTMKRWRTIIDGREREWHEEVNGVTIPIDEYVALIGVATTLNIVERWAKAHSPYNDVKLKELLLLLGAEEDDK